MTSQDDLRLLREYHERKVRSFPNDPFCRINLAALARVEQHVARLEAVAKAARSTQECHSTRERYHDTLDDLDAALAAVSSVGEE